MGVNSDTTKTGFNQVIISDSVHSSGGSVDALNYGTMVTDSVTSKIVPIASVLELISTTKAFYVPRLTTTQITAITALAPGGMAYDSTLNILKVRGASAWNTVGNVVGPTVSVANDLPVFADTSGSVLADSGILAYGTDVLFGLFGVSTLGAVRNTGFGNQVFQSLNVAFAADNTAMGAGSMQNATFSDRNNFYGSLSGNAITGNYDNCGFGFCSLYALTGALTVAGNCAFGNYAGFSAISATGLTAVGHQSLYTYTGTGQPTAVGYQAGYGLTTGTNNVFLGYQAGYTHSTAAGCTYIGYQAGYLNNASNTTAIGTFALTSSSSTTSGNTAVGNHAGFAAITSSFLTAVGYNCFSSITTSDSGTGVGRDCALGVTGAACNAFGYRSQFNQTSGSNNCSFGAGSLNGSFDVTNPSVASASSDSCAFGHNAGSLNLGNQNVYMGSNSGRWLKNASTINNVFIGYNVCSTLNTSVIAQNVVIGAGAGTGIGTGNSYTSCTFVGYNTAPQNFGLGSCSALGLGVTNSFANGAQFATLIGASATFSGAPITSNAVMLGRSADCIVRPGGVVDVLYTSKTANYTVNSGAVADNVIQCNSSGGAFTVTMPTTDTVGRRYLICDINGSATTNNITVSPGASGNIRSTTGVSPTISLNYGYTHLLCTANNNYLVIGHG